MSKPSQNTTLLILATPVLVLGLATANVKADTIYVCWDGSGDYLTIQEGIDAASDGDEVIVCDGTYTGPGNKNLDFHGKAITVRSANGPDNCIIDCEGSYGDPHRGFYFHSGEGPDSIVEGLTITNGHANPGGGVYCEDGSSPTVTNCTFSGNSSHDGGGMYNQESSPTVTNCTFSGNWDGGMKNILSDATVASSTFSMNDGIGMENLYSNPAVTNCLFAGNDADLFGGGMANFFSNPTVANCTFSGNRSGQWGGGMYNVESNPTMTQCTSSGNRSGQWGGGMYNFESNPTMTHCTFSGNETSDCGGGMYNDASSPTVILCTIVANGASWGGGFYCANNSSPGITGCKVTGNFAGRGGAVCCSDAGATIADTTFGYNTAWHMGGAYWDYHGATAMTNCILWGDSVYQGGPGPELYMSEGSTVSVSYSDVEGGEGGVYVGEGCVLDWGLGNIDMNPLFPDASYGAWTQQATYDSEAYQITFVDGNANWADNGLASRLLNADTDPQWVATYLVITNRQTTVTVWADAWTIKMGGLWWDVAGKSYEIHDQHVIAGSPCIDAGDNEGVPADVFDFDEDANTEEPIPFDLDGNPRFIDDPDTEDTGNPDPDYPELPIVDMGAYEFQIPGDLNGDRCVDQGDLGILLADWGCTGGGCPGDCDHDGDTDQADLGILLAHWGEGCP